MIWMSTFSDTVSVAVLSYMWWPAVQSSLFTSARLRFDRMFCSTVSFIELILQVLSKQVIDVWFKPVFILENLKTIRNHSHTEHQTSTHEHVVRNSYGGRYVLSLIHI